MDAHILKAYNLKLHRILLSDLFLVRKPDDSNRNKTFMRGLEESIEELGVLMPLLVMQSPDHDHKFILIDGYKRLEVLKRVNPNILAVNVLIAEGSEENISFSVNRVRGELSKLYQALYLHNIIAKERITQDELARRFMLSKGEISKLLKVAKNPTLVKMVTTGMTMTSAKSLAMSVSALKPEAREKQLQSVKNALPVSDLSSRKFEKITKVISDYIDKTHEIMDTRKVKKVYDMIKNNNNYVNTDKVVKSLIENSNIEIPPPKPVKIIEAFKTICESTSPENFKFDLSDSGTVSLKLKMSPDEFRRFKQLVGDRYFSEAKNTSASSPYAIKN